MKINSVSPARRAAFWAVGALSLSAGALCLPVLMPLAVAAPAPARVLEIWPGQRVVLVLPLTVGPDWDGGPELAETVKPIVRPELQRALTETGKFSVTLPYRFDPILRRAVVENRIPQDIITSFLDTPTLETAQPVFTQLKFDQVPMVMQAQIEELRVGGTDKAPTAQLQVSAKLYEVGGGGPFRTIVVTSNPTEGKTPEARLQNAAADAFGQIATYFVKPPEAFQLGLAPTPIATPSVVAPGEVTPGAVTPGAVTPGVVAPGATNNAMNDTVNPVPVVSVPQRTMPAMRPDLSLPYTSTHMIPVVPVSPAGTPSGGNRNPSR